MKKNLNFVNVVLVLMLVGIVYLCFSPSSYETFKTKSKIVYNKTSNFIEELTTEENTNTENEVTTEEKNTKTIHINKIKVVKDSVSNNITNDTIPNK